MQNKTFFVQTFKHVLDVLLIRPNFSPLLSPGQSLCVLYPRSCLCWGFPFWQVGADPVFFPVWAPDAVTPNSFVSFFPPWHPGVFLPTFAAHRFILFDKLKILSFYFIAIYRSQRSSLKTILPFLTSIFHLSVPYAILVATFNSYKAYLFYSTWISKIVFFQIMLMVVSECKSGPVCQITLIKSSNISG